MQDNRTIFESLENRTLISASPATFKTYLETSWQLDDPGFGGTRSTALHVELSPMMQSQVKGDLSSGRDVDMFRVGLVRGQYFNATLSTIGMQLTLYDASGKGITATTTGSLFYRVPQSGSYYVRLSSLNSQAAKRAYSLDLRPIGLNTGQVDPTLLQSEVGGMYAIRDGRSLHISGPTGHGFTLVGNWQQKTVGTGNSTQTTYSATGLLTLRSVVGEIPIPIPRAGSVRIATTPNRWGKYFGEIDSIDLGINLGPMDFATPFGRTWGIVFNNRVGGGNSGGGGWGIKLGGDPLLESTGLPLNPDVPYFFYTDTRGFFANFGGINANVKNSAGFSVVVDPSDSFFIGAKGVPVVGDVAFGVSTKGLIPFTPNATPSAFTGDHMFGNVYIKAGLDISAIVPEVPINLDGDIVIDLDANNDGKFLGGIKTNVSRMLAGGFTPEALGSTAGRVLGDINIGVNGHVNLGWENSLFELSVPVAEGSLIYSASKGGIFTRGRSANPFDGTPLENLIKPAGSIDIDSYAYRNGTFRLQASGTYKPGPFTMNGSVVVDNAGARVSGNIRALGANARLNGSVLPDGRFTLTGTSNVRLGPLSGKANFTLRNTGHAVSFLAGMNSTLSTNIAGVSIGGSVSANLAFSVNSRGLTYSGSGRAKLFVGPVSIGPSVQISRNELSIGIDARPVLQAYIRVPLPA